MPSTKEELRRKYAITDADFDVLTALALRPTCERCAQPLPPEATNARICSFECTFCATCVEHLHHVCPNCGGGFTPRPVRPKVNWRNGNYLGNYPASSTRIERPPDPVAHARLVAAVGGRRPEDR